MMLYMSMGGLGMGGLGMGGLGTGGLGAGGGGHRWISPPPPIPLPPSVLLRPVVVLFVGSYTLVSLLSVVPLGLRMGRSKTGRASLDAPSVSLRPLLVLVVVSPTCCRCCL